MTAVFLLECRKIWELASDKMRRDHGSNTVSFSVEWPKDVTVREYHEPRTSYEVATEVSEVA